MLPIGKQLLAAEAFALIGISWRWLEYETGSDEFRHGDVRMRPVLESCETCTLLDKVSIEIFKTNFCMRRKGGRREIT